jgi:hypothetical protein
MPSAPIAGQREAPTLRRWPGSSPPRGVGSLGVADRAACRGPIVLVDAVLGGNSAQVAGQSRRATGRGCGRDGPCHSSNHSEGYVSGRCWMALERQLDRDGVDLNFFSGRGRPCFADGRSVRTLGPWSDQAQILAGLLDVHSHHESRSARHVGLCPRARGRSTSAATAVRSLSSSHG